MGERMTRAGYEQLLAALDDLEQGGRAEIARLIRDARGFGEISENAEYQSALDEQAHLEARISRLHDRLEMATIVDPEVLPDDVVRVESLVEVEDETGERLRLRVASQDGDPDAEIATLDSPLGRAVLGARVGDVLEIRAPRRTWRARVVAVQS
ncbi:MAG: hypothetical protein C5B48_09250 [Candidatus Rokuibacteriota bacterium]|nr:MAG: hypothetical protein C5B48_09250 [Candidatus Rokubacteria bacterium]